MMQDDMMQVAHDMILQRILIRWFVDPRCWFYTGFVDFLSPDIGFSKDWLMF